MALYLICILIESCLLTTSNYEDGVAASVETALKKVPQYLFLYLFRLSVKGEAGE